MFTSDKGDKRRLYCRLYMARGLNHEGVRTLIFFKRKLNDDMMNHTNTPVDYDKVFKNYYLQGQLILVIAPH